MANPVQGADGVVFEVTIVEDEVAIDMSAATGLFLDFTKPYGGSLQKAAAFTTDGTDGKIEVSLSSAELDQAGVWQIQARFTLGSFVGPTAFDFFVVDPAIA